ncbi:MAG: hypothetical protein JWQ38_595 [Flavipsychrobacter sp.]|nr:hypothetical protein [Flavipsychrobacter sp.]
MPARVLLFIFLCITSQVYATTGNYVYNYNDNCSKAYQAYLALHIPEARSSILMEMRADPYNLMATYISDYEDCLTLLLNCDKAEYEQRKEHFDARLQLLDKGNPSSPWYRFCKAGLYMHWAIVHTRFGEQYKAALKFRKSFALLKENQQLFPTFGYNQVFAGLQEAVIGSLPGNYKWLVSVFGISGNMKKGIGKLSMFINTHTQEQPLYTEAVLYELYTRFYLAYDQKEVWNLLNNPHFITRNNLLNSFVKANIALDYHKADDAIMVLQSATNNINYDQYPIFNFQLGLAMLTKSDIGCVGYFQKYIEKNKSDLYIKECWQKMSWAWYIAGNMKQAQYCRLQITLSGSTRLDADKQAEKFAQNSGWPVKEILHARLLIDGGYSAQALVLLNALDVKTIANPADKAEYYFRLGRVYEGSGDNKKALDNYRYTINIGKDRHEQFAARAALQIGLIYERTGAATNALSSFHQCLNMPAHDFQNSIDQLAKAGIHRIEGN